MAAAEWQQLIEDARRSGGIELVRETRVPGARPFFRAADSFSRVRSPISSRSNCANESRMFGHSKRLPKPSPYWTSSFPG
jgi:hypothetical protein